MEVFTALSATSARQFQFAEVGPAISSPSSRAKNSLEQLVRGHVEQLLAQLGFQISTLITGSSPSLAANAASIRPRSPLDRVFCLVRPSAARAGKGRVWRRGGLSKLFGRVIQTTGGEVRQAATSRGSASAGFRRGRQP